MGKGEESSILAPVAKSQSSHAWPADFSLVFTLAPELRALEGLSSVVANNFFQISHMDCAALLRPPGDWILTLKNPTKLSWGKRVKAALPYDSECAVYSFFPQLLLKAPAHLLLHHTNMDVGAPGKKGATFSFPLGKARAEQRVG